MTATEASSAGQPTRPAAVGPAPDVLDLDRLCAQIQQLSARYQSAQPFPHIVLENFLEEEAARLAIDEFPALNSEEWNSFIHANESKFSNTRPDTWGPTLRAALDVFQSPRFVAFLSQLTGIDDLLVDESLMGGGLHQSVAGGFLNIHADFTVHPSHRTWRRRVNLLLYLNKEWPAAYGGDLELWSTDMKRCEVSVAPVANRAVIFTTAADSFHGHPDPLRCPPGMARQSMALYYFTEEDSPLVRSTEYRARPEDGPVRSTVIYVDKQVLRAYDWTKRRLGISDHSAGRILGRIERLRRPRR
ncbi:MAG TPA: 2OG-Fe(II) oxygenase [Acidimicrobiales bacterium]|nr:2OG-Fe(II) oxygenase [Acidimicrobiales bacterium]